jgi:DUF971 family protein
MTAIAPTKITRKTEKEIGIGLIIDWSDSTTTEISAKKLRENCPCASCLQTRGDTSHQAPLSSGKSILKVIKADLNEQVDLVRIWAIGNYAIGIRWKDNHDSGIFTYKFLYDLANNTNWT